VRGQGEAPARGAAVNAYVCTIDVESLDETLKSIVANGGEIVRCKARDTGHRTTRVRQKTSTGISLEYCNRYKRDNP